MARDSPLEQLGQLLTIKRPALSVCVIRPCVMPPVAAALAFDASGVRFVLIGLGGGPTDLVVSYLERCDPLVFAYEEQVVMVFSCRLLLGRSSFAPRQQGRWILQSQPGVVPIITGSS